MLCCMFYLWAIIGFSLLVSQRKCADDNKHYSMVKHLFVTFELCILQVPSLPGFRALWLEMDQGFSLWASPSTTTGLTACHSSTASPSVMVNDKIKICKSWTTLSHNSKTFTQLCKKSHCCMNGSETNPLGVLTCFGLWSKLKYVLLYL